LHQLLARFRIFVLGTLINRLAFPRRFPDRLCTYHRLFLPESPRWLILKGKEEEALEVLAALSDLPIEDPTIHADFVAIKDTVFEMAKGSFRDLFTMNETRHCHRTVLAYVNQVFQQISGINLITYYAATIYQNQIGLSHTLSTIIAAANGTE